MSAPTQQTMLMTASGSIPGPEAAAFLARTTGLDWTHRNAYIDLINGLVADGVWSSLDVLQIYATQDSTTALLNLVSSSFPAVSHGSPSFTADRGFTGSSGSSTVYMDTGFNPSTAGGHYAQNSAHISDWIVTNANNANPGVGAASASSGNVPSEYIYEQYIDGNAYFRINVTGGGASASVAASTGHFLGNRSSSSAIQGYRNGSSINSATGQTSNTLLNLNLYTLGINANGTAVGVGRQCAMFSAGSSLSSTNVTNFYNRLRTYMTTVGVP